MAGYEMGFDGSRGHQPEIRKRTHVKPTDELRATLMGLVANQTPVRVVDGRTGDEIYSGPIIHKSLGGASTLLYQHPRAGEMPIGLRTSAYDPETKTIRIGLSQ